ncbi:hemagglutinin repeat-containing protein [Uliginosibacterium sp. H3]|uniref:Hemagglutinin repeat-containing protein n=1 Tax=Uliginosibacterium silvisoli TaxID=3114758 RepID=A0ABU6JYZ6_9RHOO|nr:hemagglutinin repeat-containing protein [Uliginosibacterium sp. H3]
MKTTNRTSNRTPLRLTAVSIAMIQAALLTPSLGWAADPAGMSAANGNTGVSLAPNGVPVVNIANPNAAGVSHNQYNQFNVDNRGAVLNNGDMSQVTRNSQLAGQVYGNPNLASQAKIIVNEVVSPNRSQLNGYIEVLGGKANVVVANPFGISCNGCGFINTDRASLTTGTPVFGANGSLTGFQVNGGDVQISGLGLDGKAQSFFDIVTRSVKIDAQVNAQDLNISTGSGNWDYTNRSGNMNTAAGGTPEYAVDSTALGGMYANRIKIVASEAGVGVRMLGDAAATAADFTIDAAGKVQLAGRLSAQGNLAVAGAGIDVSGSNASLATHGNLSLAAGNAAINLNDATLTADGALNVSAASLNDASTNATRFSGGDANLNVTGAANITGANWGAGGKLSAAAGSLTLTNSSAYSGSDLSLASTNGKLDLGAASLKSVGNMSLAAQGGKLVAAGGGSGVNAAGNLNLAASGAVENGAQMISGGDVSLNAASLTNTGLLQAAGNENLSVATLNNSGSLLSAGTTLKGNSLDNSGTIQGTQNLAVQLASSLDNRAAGKLVSTGALSINGGSGTLATLNNAGLIEAGTANLNATTQINSGTVIANRTSLVAATLDNSGKIQGTQNVDVQLSSNLNNRASGAITSDDSLAIHGAALINAGVIQAANGATLSGTSLSNQGVDAAILTSTTGNNAGSINVTGALNNDGLIYGNGNLSLTAGSINNASTGGVSSGNGDLNLTTTAGNVDNHGALYAGNKLSVLTRTGTSAWDFINHRSGAVGGTNLDFKVGNFTNYNEIIATNKIDIDTRGNFTNTISNDAEGMPTVTTRTDYINGNGYVSGMQPAAGTSASEGPFNVYVQNYWNSGGGQYNIVYTSTVRTSEVLSNATGLQSAKLIGGNAIALNIGGTGSNVGSLISAPDVTITTPNPFENRSINLTTTTTNKLWMSDITGSDWDLYVPQTLTEYNYLLNATGASLYPIAESGNVTCWCNVGGLSGGYPSFSESMIGQQTTIWPRLSAGGETDWNNARASAYAYVTTTGSTPASAQIKANSLVINGSLSNIGTTRSNENRTPSAPGVTTTPGAGVYVPGARGQTFSGLNTALPTNPNGFFVTSKNPNSQYLIESNPRFSQGAGGYGSEYLFSLFGYDPNLIQKRLGDANYEAKLIRDELIAQTGRNLLAGYDSSAAQMQALMDSAYAQSYALGLQIGQPLTAAQAASLKSDLVWMVEQEVNGQKVLAPVVYLAAATRDAIATGAVIDAKVIVASGDSFRNIGGTIIASDALTVKTTGDIVNTSGTIKGGNIALTSTKGSIRNDIAITDAAADGKSNGQVGRQGSIEATGSLKEDAKRDIVIAGSSTSAGGNMSLKAGDNINVRSVVNEQSVAADNVSKASIAAGKLTIDAGNDVKLAGADVKAREAASIKAGRDVVLDTVEKHTSTLTGSSEIGANSNSWTATRTDTTKQIGTTLDVGSNLNVKSGRDVTVAGSTVNVAGDATVDAKRNLNIIDRQDKSVATTTSRTESIDSGMGGVSFNDTKTTTVPTTTTSVGSGINIGGNGTLKAGNTLTVKGSDVATGGNLDLNAKSIKVLAGENSVDTVSHTESKSQGMSMSANANGSGFGYTNSKTTTDETGSSSTARVSTLTSGGNITRTATDKITDQGTQITTGGDFTQKAKSIEMLAAENKQSGTSTSHTDSNSVGISVQYGFGTAYEDAKKGSAAGTVSAAGGATVGIDYAHQTKDSNSSSNASQAVVTTVKSGGKISSTSTLDTRLEGADLSSKGDTEISARKLTVDAARNTTSSTNSSSQTDVGARVSVDMSGKPGGEVSASHSNEQGSSDSSTAVVGKINAGGNLKIKTSGDTNLEGTQLGAKGDAQIDAGGSVNMTAANNTDNSSSSNYSAGGTVGASKDAANATVNYSGGSEDNKSSTAVTGSITAGNNISITSGKNVKLEGTDLTSGKDTTIDAKGKVDVLAATSTTESNKSQLNVTVSGQGSKGQSGFKHDGKDIGTAAVTGSGSDASSTTQKVSNIKTGGNLNVKSGGKTTLEGTQGDVGGKATLTAGGGVVQKDVVSSSKDSSTAGGISIVSGKGGPLGAAGMKHGSHSSTATTSVSIKENQANKTKAASATTSK